MQIELNALLTSAASGSLRSMLIQKSCAQGSCSGGWRLTQTFFFWWRSRLPLWVKDWPQWAQEKGLAPMCVLTWSITLQSLEKVFAQIRHWSSWFNRPVSWLRFCTLRNPFPFVILPFTDFLRSTNCRSLVLLLVVTFLIG